MLHRFPVTYLAHMDCWIVIQLREDAQPYSISTARRIPFLLLGKVEQELKQMIDADIEEVKEPMKWCAPMVPVWKAQER